jgi:cyclophilin family peptidyl-prolyl cis-trans isomerase
MRVVHVLTLLTGLTVTALLAGCGPDGSNDVGAPKPGVPGPIREGDTLAEIDAFIAQSKIDRSSPGWKTRLPKPIQVGFPKDKHVHWTLETNKGRIVAKLWHEVAPLHVSHFAYLTRLGFYNGLIFHRVIRGFMAQGGCPNGNGRGWPGYALPRELRADVKHSRPGLLSTANAGGNASDGSQFFIMFDGPRPGGRYEDVIRKLDGGYTLFGEVVEGLDVVRAMEAVGASGDPGTPKEPLIIERASVDLR